MSLLETLRPVKCLVPKKRFGPPNDGGYVIVPQSFGIEGILGYGVGGDIQFENQISEFFNVPCWVFDHTVMTCPERGPNVTWVTEGITGLEETDKLRRLETHVEKYIGSGKKYLLKIDIEDNEWDVIENTNFDCVQQLIIEIHELDEKTEKKEALLKKILKDFDLIHIHGGNCHNQPVFMYDRVTPIPRYLECTFVRKGLVPCGGPSNEDWPTPYDTICRLDAKDVKQDFWKREPYIRLNFDIQPEHVDLAKTLLGPGDAIGADPGTFDGFTLKLLKGESFPWPLVFYLYNVKEPVNICIPIIVKNVLKVAFLRVTHPRATQSFTIVSKDVAIFAKTLPSE